MSSSTSNRWDSSSSALSPPGSSSEPSDVSVLPSHAESQSTPVSVLSEVSTNRQAFSRFKECCYCGICGRYTDSFFHKLDSNESTGYKIIIFTAAGIILTLICSFTKPSNNAVYWELIYVLSLVLCYCLLTCCFKRGCYSKSFWRTYRKRNPVDDGSPNEAQGQESTTDAAPAENQTDSPSDESHDAPVLNVEVEADLHQDPGTSRMESEECSQKFDDEATLLPKN